MKVAEGRGGLQVDVEDAAALPSLPSLSFLQDQLQHYGRSVKEVLGNKAKVVLVRSARVRVVAGVDGFGPLWRAGECCGGFGGAVEGCGGHGGPWS